MENNYQLILDENKKMLPKNGGNVLCSGTNKLFMLEGEASGEYFIYIDATKDNAFLNVSGNIKNAKFVFLVIGDNEVVVKNMFNVENNLEMAIFFLTKGFGKFATKCLHQEKNAQSKINICSLNSGSKSHIFSTTTIHEAIKTKSFINAFGISKNKSETVFLNEGRIKLGALKSEVKQNCKGLILDEGSFIEAKPVLYIDENDVLANHGAAIGAIDENLIYYLQSRGITKKSAKKMIILSYIDQVLDLVKKDVQKIIYKAVERLFND